MKCLKWFPSLQQNSQHSVYGDGGEGVKISLNDLAMVREIEKIRLVEDFSLDKGSLFLYKDGWD